MFMSYRIDGLFMLAVWSRVIHTFFTIIYKYLFYNEAMIKLLFLDNCDQYHG